MHIIDTITPERCQLGLQATSRKKTLQALANIFSQHSNQNSGKSSDQDSGNSSGKNSDQSSEKYDSFDILKALTAREQLGTTAIGHGIALPHGRLEACKEPIAILATLEESVDFLAADKENVDVIFALLIPQELDFRDLKGIELVKTIFDNKTLCAQIRHSHNNEALFEIIEHAIKEFGDKEEK